MKKILLTLLLMSLALPTLAQPAKVALPWPEVSNTRTYVVDGSEMSFTTGSVLGQKITISAVPYGSNEDIFRTWAVYKADTRTPIASQFGQQSTLRFIVGETVYNKGFGGGVLFYGLKPNTEYLFKNANKNKDGSESCTRPPCNFLVDMQRTFSK